MRLDLSRVLRNDGSAMPFSFECDLSQLEMAGQKPFQTPARVDGSVTNRSGTVELSFDVTVNCHTVCDRCGKPVEKSLSAHFLSYLSNNDQDIEKDDYIVFEGNELDLTPLVESAVVLDYPSKFLCGESCKGLCGRCGADLNLGDCGCVEDEIDPRLARLKDLL